MNYGKGLMAYWKYFLIFCVRVLLREYSDRFVASTEIQPSLFQLKTEGSDFIFQTDQFKITSLTVEINMQMLIYATYASATI